MSDQKIPLDERVGTGRRAGRLTASLRAHGTGRLSSPGQLLTPEVGVAVAETGGVALAEYAIEHGLRPSAQRPSVWSYLLHLWRRRQNRPTFSVRRVD